VLDSETAHRASSPLRSNRIPFGVVQTQHRCVARPVVMVLIMAAVVVMVMR